MNYADIVNVYLEKDRKFEEEKNRTEDRIEMRQKQIKRLERKLEKTGWISWVTEIVEKLAVELSPFFPDRNWQRLGPFGLGCQTSIHFRKKEYTGDEFDGDNTISITFEPIELKEGKLGIVDYETDLKKYSPGTLGYINGMNHPVIPIEQDITLEELAKFVK